MVTWAVMNPRSSNQSRVSGVPETGPSYARVIDVM